MSCSTGWHTHSLLCVLSFDWRRCLKQMNPLAASMTWSCCSGRSGQHIKSTGEACSRYVYAAEHLFVVCCRMRWHPCVHEACDADIHCDMCDATMLLQLQLQREYSPGGVIRTNAMHTAAPQSVMRTRGGAKAQEDKPTQRPNSVRKVSSRCIIHPSTAL